VRQNIDVRGRIAGQSAMAAVIEAQSHSAPRSTLGRLFGVSPLTAEGRVHYRGAVGELLVGSILDRLGHSWDVLHGVPVGSSSLDHFAVGRPGVFAISVVNCQGDEVAVNGNELTIAKRISDDILVARDAAQVVSESLAVVLEDEVPVTPVLVLVEPVKLAMLKTPDGVDVLTSMQLEQWLASAPAVLSGDRVAAISVAAEADVTWPQPQQAAQKSRTLTRAFVRIHHEVRAAEVRRLVWMIGALVTTAVGAWTLVSVLTGLIVSS